MRGARRRENKKSKLNIRHTGKLYYSNIYIKVECSVCVCVDIVTFICWSTHTHHTVYSQNGVNISVCSSIVEPRTCEYERVWYWELSWLWREIGFVSEVVCAPDVQITCHHIRKTKAFRFYFLNFWHEIACDPKNLLSLSRWLAGKSSGRRRNCKQESKNRWRQTTTMFHGTGRNNKYTAGEQWRNTVGSWHEEFVAQTTTTATMEKKCQKCGIRYGVVCAVCSSQMHICAICKFHVFLECLPGFVSVRSRFFLRFHRIACCGLQFQTLQDAIASQISNTICESPNIAIVQTVKGDALEQWMVNTYTRECRPRTTITDREDQHKILSVQYYCCCCWCYCSVAVDIRLQMANTHTNAVTCLVIVVVAIRITN